MILSSIISSVADGSTSNASVASVKARIIREINLECEKQWNNFPWSFRSRNYRFATTPEQTTGTVTATNGSRTITFSGTTVLSNQVNWLIRFDGDSTQNWYRVRAYTNSTTLELDLAYQGTSGSTKAYTLRKTDYVLPTEIVDIGSLYVTYGPLPVELVSADTLDAIQSAPVSKGTPVCGAIYSSDFVPTVYSTGTITGTTSTLTVTGVGTAWLDNVFPGDLLTVGSYTYTVRDVNSDTSLTLYNYQMVSSATATYTITRQFGRILRLAFSSDQNYALDLRGFRSYAPLVHDNDANEFTNFYPAAVVGSGKFLEIEQKPDPTYVDKRLAADTEWDRARAQDQGITGKMNKRSLYSGYRQQMTDSLR